MSWWKCCIFIDIILCFDTVVNGINNIKFLWRQYYTRKFYFPHLSFRWKRLLLLESYSELISYSFFHICECIKVIFTMLVIMVSLHVKRRLQNQVTWCGTCGGFRVIQCRGKNHRRRPNQQNILVVCFWDYISIVYFLFCLGICLFAWLVCYAVFSGCRWILKRDMLQRHGESSAFLKIIEFLDNWSVMKRIVANLLPSNLFSSFVWKLPWFSFLS